jgi:hypothetical protein
MAINQAPPPKNKIRIWERFSPTPPAILRRERAKNIPRKLKTTPQMLFLASEDKFKDGNFW